MATLALAVAGAAVGSAVLPAGVTVLGATLTGAAHRLPGRRARRLLHRPVRCSAPPASRAPAHGPAPLRAARHRLLRRRAHPAPLRPRAPRRPDHLGDRLRGGGGHQSSSGAAAARAALGSGRKTTTIEYRYFANFAVALAEGEITGLGRVWADGQELDLSTVTYRLYTGSETQLPDSLIEAQGRRRQRAGLPRRRLHRVRAPGARRLRQPHPAALLRGAPRRRHLRRLACAPSCLIPGAGEFVYAHEARHPQGRRRHQRRRRTCTRCQGGTDWDVAIDQLQATLPNAGSVSLVVGWFGTDLRAGHCEIRPGVDSADKITAPLTWSVAGLSRADAHLVSTHRRPRGLRRHALG